MIRRFRGVSARTKILLFAFLFIMLPSGLLGYLGFRSIGARRLSLKENYRSMASLMRDELERGLADLEGRFLKEILAREWTQDTEAIRLLLGEVRERHAGIGEAFLIGSDGSLVHPRFYLEGGLSRRTESGSALAARNSLIVQGERYEFAELDYSNAARSYEEAINLAASPELRTYARLLLGRCYFKMKAFSKAAEQYRILSEQGPGFRGSDGTPLKIIGLFRLAETFAALGDGGQEARTRLALFEELIRSPSGFESREFYLETVRTDLDGLFENSAIGNADRDRWEQLRKEDRSLAETVHRLEGTRQALLSQLSSEASANANLGPGQGLPSAFRVTVRDEEGRSRRLGYLFLPSDGSLPLRRIVAYELDGTYVLTDLFPRLSGRRASGNGVRAALYGESGPLTSLPDAPQLGQALAVESLSEYFPGWSLALFDKRGKSIDQLVRGEMRSYTAVLLGIAVLIVAGIAMTLRAATHEAETVRLRSDFISNVSHELKTPLSLIRLFGETMESERSTDDVKRREFSGIIARESRRLSHLIDNVLDFSKIDSGRKEYRFEKGDLVEVVADTVEAYRYYLRDQGFAYDVSLPPGPVVMSMDKDAIAQALMNLLNNAEKYSGERKHIGVKMAVQGSHVSIIVEDKGPGIPPADLKHIFEKFYRGGHAPAREAQGCGLGLTIVKDTVENHGGSVGAESEPGRGSRFTITLPLRGRDEGSGRARGENG